MSKNYWSLYPNNQDGWVDMIDDDYRPDPYVAILNDIADEYSGKIKIAKLNIDENPGTPAKFGVRGIPTLMIFKSGSIEATKVGAMSKSQLSAFIDSTI